RTAPIRAAALGSREGAPANGGHRRVGRLIDPPSSGRPERRQIDVLDLVDRQLQEARAQRAEGTRITGREETIEALALAVVLVTLPCQRLRDLACSLLRREHERHLTAEHALEDRTDQRVVRAPEDDG